MKPAPSRQQLDCLRRQIKALEPPPPDLPHQVNRLRPTERGQAAPLQLGPGLHEICPASYLDTPAALAFQTGLLAQRMAGGDTAGTTQAARPQAARPIVWVRHAGARGQDFGRPCPQSLAQWGIAPDRVLLVEGDEAKDVLWAMEEALRAGALVIGEVGGAARYDLTATKRLHMAAREKGAVALVLRSHDTIQPSAALTRWRIAALPSPARPWRGSNGLPGLGAPRFRAVLERVRGGPPRNYEIEWKNAAFHVLEPAPLAHRTATSGPERRAG